MFNYDVMTEEAAMKERYSLLEDGEYNAVIFDCLDKISQSSGNPMFEIHVHIHDTTGKTTEIRDFLTFTPKMMWKVINCCKSADVFAEYESKKLNPAILKKRNVRIKVKSQKGSLIPIDKLNGKPHGSCYPDKNVIDDYLPMMVTTGMKPLPDVKNDFHDDALPF